MSQSIKVILFDLGNVLVDVDYSIAAKRISHFCEATPSDIIARLLSTDVTRLFEEGSITPEDFFSRLQEMFNLRLSYQAFVPIWNEVFFLSSKNRFVYSLANNLRSNYTIAILSNINILHYEYLKKHFPVFSIFHNVFTSCLMGLVKPEPEIYKKTLIALRVSPGEVFYTDDRDDLIKSASSLEINSFVFTDAKKLKQDLLNSGIVLS